MAALDPQLHAINVRNGGGSIPQSKVFSRVEEQHRRARTQSPLAAGTSGLMDIPVEKTCSFSS
jgi:hypothetical protein